MSEKIKNILIIIVVFLLILALAIYGYMTSDFSNIDKANNGMNNKLKAQIAKKRYYNTDVKIKDNSLVSLGDFEINIGSGQKLITNISAKYDEPDGWGLSSSIEDELKSKGALMRHSVIEAIMNQKEKDVRSYRVKSAIIDKMNTNLSSTKIENIYFNRLIIAD